MRKFIIDTDTASDDAVGLIMALCDKNIDILGITTVSGNIPCELATKNALTVVDLCEKNTGVYIGAKKPLFRDLVVATSIHGNDGLGDCGLAHPISTPQNQHAVDFMIETIKSNGDGEIEIIALGPVTNIALAILKEPDVMRKVKHIYSMGTAGFGAGNTSPVAEFNVFVDAESYKIMLESGIDITIIGFDLCLGDAALQKSELDILSSGGKKAVFTKKCTSALLEYNLQRGSYSVDLPDAVAVAVALWEDIVIEGVDAFCYCCTQEKYSYGQVIVHTSDNCSLCGEIPCNNAKVIKRIDSKAFVEKLMDCLA